MGGKPDSSITVAQQSAGNSNMVIQYHNCTETRLDTEINNAFKSIKYISEVFVSPGSEKEPKYENKWANQKFMQLKLQ
jgi:hypothetical protein